MFKSIPQARMLIYLVILGLLPTLLVLLKLWQDSDSLNALQDRILEVQEKALIRDSKQAVNMAVIEHFQGSDNIYLDKYVQKLQFLESEVEGLQRLITNKSFADDEEATKRYEHLVGPNNTLMFNEGAVVRYPLFREVVETQVRPVEVNLTDIQKILTLIDGVPFGENSVPPKRPQLIILDFRLEKKRINEDNEAFLMNMRLLKREYL